VKVREQKAVTRAAQLAKEQAQLAQKQAEHMQAKTQAEKEKVKAEAAAAEDKAEIAERKLQAGLDKITKVVWQYDAEGTWCPFSEDVCAEIEQAFIRQPQLRPAPAASVPPIPIQAPPTQVVPPGAKHIALQVEPHESLLPSGRRLQVAAADLTGLRVEIARQLGLQDLRLQVCPSRRFRTNQF
jgi:hypothetical protein